MCDSLLLLLLLLLLPCRRCLLLFTCAAHGCARQLL
jgi:hypothetical protein